MGTKCLRSVHFSSGPDQSIETPIVWGEQRNSSGPPPAEIPVHRPRVCRLDEGMVHFADRSCFLVRYVVWCQSGANSVQNRLTKVCSVHFVCLIRPTVSSFSSVRGTAAKSFRSVRSVQFTNSSGPDWAIWSQICMQLTLAGTRHYALRNHRWHKGASDLPLRVSKVNVVKLSGKNQRVALDECSRLVARFSTLDKHLTQLWEVKGQVFPRSALFYIYKSISPILLTVSKRNLHPRVLHSILSRMSYCFGILIK